MYKQQLLLIQVDPPDDEQQAGSKHVEAYYWNKLIANSASCWFILYGFVSKIRWNISEKKYFNVFLHNDGPQEERTAYRKNPF
jgi:hypothetical protein